MSKDALFRIDKISVDRLSQQVSIAGKICDRPVEAMLRIWNNGAIWLDVPVELQRHDAARRKMNEIAVDAFHGRPVPIPIDLTALVRETFSTWPAPFETIEHAIHQGEFALTRTECLEPGVFAVYFDFDRIPSEAVMDIRHPTWPTLFRFVRGAHPWQLDCNERDTLLQGLADAVRKAAGLEGTVVV